MKRRSSVLLVLTGLLAANQTRAAAQSIGEDTTIVERRGGLEFALKLSPMPRAAGRAIQIIVSVRNTGDSAVQVEVDPCQPTLLGLPPNRLIDSDTCAAAPFWKRLAPGETWSRTNPERLAIPPGRYSIRALVALSPEVWLGLDLVLAEFADSGCRDGSGSRVERRLRYLREMVSSTGSDHAATRRDLGLPRMRPYEVYLANRPNDCVRAVTALNEVRQERGVLRQVWLFDLGNRGYAVDDPGLNVGFADKVLYFFDLDFNYRMTLSGF